MIVVLYFSSLEKKCDFQKKVFLPFHDRFLAILRFHDFKIEIRFQSLFAKDFAAEYKILKRHDPKDSSI